MDEKPKLCDYCSKIDSERLRLPTIADLRSISLGSVPDRPPFKFDDSRSTAPGSLTNQTKLGSLSRIKESSPICGLCAAICSLVDERPEFQRAMLLEGMEDPECQAISLPSKWFYPLQGEHKNQHFFLYTMGLTWNGSDAPVRPGESEWFTFVNCFQARQEGFVMSFDQRHKEVNSQQPHCTQFGGLLRPPLINPELPVSWLRTCRTQHSERCASPWARRQVQSKPSCFRLINIHLKRIVEFQYSTNIDGGYAALSYVWGGKQRVVLQNSNLQALKIPESLDGGTSQTILDAMKFTGQLGVNYLWVDALCIVQDDDSDKADQISHMGSIYAHAEFTIIAATGYDSNAGLPGINVGRKATQREVTVLRTGMEQPPITLITSLSTNLYERTHILEATTWASRGWTQQEKALSRRVIMFTEEQIFWSCQETSFAEDTHSQSPWGVIRFSCLDDEEFDLTSARDSLYISSYGSDQAWYKFSRMVTEFSGRHLTMPGDALDAFSAIQQQFQNLHGEYFVWGLPASRFELGLCWEPSRSSVKRRSSVTTLPITSLNRQTSFPSWSWLGWEAAPVRLFIEDRHVEEGISPETLCYVLRNSPLRLVRVSRVSSDSPQASHLNLKQLQHQNLRSPLAICLTDIINDYPCLTRSRLLDTPDDQLIFFRAECARFQVSSPVLSLEGAYNPRNPVYAKHLKYHQSIIDDASRVVGKTTTCEASEKDEDRLRDFIHIADNRTLGAKPRKIALQVEFWDGIFHRINIAEINEGAWERTMPTSRLVALG